MLHVQALVGGYGRIVALRSVHLEVRQGELVAVIGRNGAGKTTLLRTISGLQPSFAGTIHFEGRDVTRATAADLVRAGIAHVPEGRQVFGTLSVEDNLRLGAYYRAHAEAEVDLARQYELFPVLRERRETLAGVLSGGQQQMLALGRGLMAAPRLLMLDEPSMGLAPQFVSQIFRTIVELKKRGTTILLIEQNAKAALRIADRAYVIENGETVLEGPAGVIADNPSVKSLYLGR